MSFNPDENLMYTNRHDPAQSRLQPCFHGDYFTCPEELDPQSDVCTRCGMGVLEFRKQLGTKADPQVVGAQVANLLTAAERGEDMVNLPAHYARFKIEPMHFIVANGLNWFQGNVLKYILRYDAKNGLEDLKKAQRYLEMFIKWVEGDPDWWRHPSKQEVPHVGCQAG